MTKLAPLVFINFLEMVRKLVSKIPQADAGQKFRRGNNEMSIMWRLYSVDTFQSQRFHCRSQSHTRIPQRERMGGLDMMTASPAPQSVDSAGLLLSTTNSVSVSSPPSSMRHPTGGVSSALMQTKTVELDPQPNNVNAELGGF